jgi:hypothetical protein
MSQKCCNIQTIVFNNIPKNASINSLTLIDNNGVSIDLGNYRIYEEVINEEES